MESHERDIEEGGKYSRDPLNETDKRRLDEKRRETQDERKEEMYSDAKGSETRREKAHPFVMREHTDTNESILSVENIQKEDEKFFVSPGGRCPLW